MSGFIVARTHVPLSSLLGCRRLSECKLAPVGFVQRFVHLPDLCLVMLTLLHRYVEYAMHRVRLLQYHKITPYVVFDGGPLPAKKGTEVERKRYVIPFSLDTTGICIVNFFSKRDENLDLANTLARQGKHSQAREHYVKCVDITPQMAFQLIKVRNNFII